MRRATVVAAALGLAAAGAACGASGGSDGRTADGRLAVVAGFYPLAEAAQRVGGERVAVANLTPAGAEPHDLELSSRQVDRIEDAAVVFYLGQGFQPAVAAAAERASGLAVDLLDGEVGPLVGGDPHVWLDPTRQARIAEEVRAALARADPAGQADYRANATAYQGELAALDERFRAGLADCDRRVLVTSHDAFGYLASRYDLRQEAIAGLSPESEPEPRRLAELAAKVRAEGITTIFSETLVAPDVAETLAREAGVATAVLDPLEGLAEERRRAGTDYAAVMADNLVALRAALGCR